MGLQLLLFPKLSFLLSAISVAAQNHKKKCRVSSRNLSSFYMQGSHRFEVPNGQRMRVTSGTTGLTLVLVVLFVVRIPVLVRF